MSLKSSLFIIFYAFSFNISTVNDLNSLLSSSFMFVRELNRSFIIILH